MEKASSSVEREVEPRNEVNEEEKQSNVAKVDRERSSGIRLFEELDQITPSVTDQLQVRSFSVKEASHLRQQQAYCRHSVR